MKFKAKAPGRLDATIASEHEELSRARIQKGIKDGAVSVNGEVITKPSYTLSEGDSIECNFNEQTGKSVTAITPIDQSLEVLFEDDACMVLSKPAGIAVHSGHAMEPDEPTLLNGIAYLFEQRSLPFSADAVLVHRLDKPTTGCILVAKNYNSFSFLQQQFENRTTKKQYLALVAGLPEHSSATIDAPIGRNLTNRTKMSVLQTSTSKEARTDYEVLDSNADAALLLCTLHTGRTHQIRVHLTSIGHPILGDDSYSSSASEKLSKHFATDNLCLHAWQLGFVSPADNAEHQVTAPVADSFSSALKATALALPHDTST